MNMTRFDRISTLFSQRRLAGRNALANGTTPETSPRSPPEGDRTATLFVQSFRGGTIAAKEGEQGRFTVILTGGLGKTIAFSDRPERNVSAAPTSAFLEGLRFSADNPPNAALVVDSADGGVDIAVIELTNPIYDAASATATYEATALPDHNGTDLRLQEAPRDLAALPASFGSAHLFIDDCPDAKVGCIGNHDKQHHGFAGTAGLCWDWSDWSCKFCDPDACYWRCNDTIPACNRDCWASEDFG